MSSSPTGLNSATHPETPIKRGETVEGRERFNQCVNYTGTGTDIGVQWPSDSSSGCQRDKIRTGGMGKGMHNCK